MIKRGRGRDSRVVRNSLKSSRYAIWDQSGVLAYALMSGSMALEHQGSVSTKGQMDAPGLSCHLGIC